jgi:hypothetical protein
MRMDGWRDFHISRENEISLKKGAQKEFSNNVCRSAFR